MKRDVCIGVGHCIPLFISGQAFDYLIVMRLRPLILKENSKRQTRIMVPPPASPEKKKKKTLKDGIIVKLVGTHCSIVKRDSFFRHGARIFHIASILIAILMVYVHIHIYIYMYIYIHILLLSLGFRYGDFMVQQ